MAESPTTAERSLTQTAIRLIGAVLVAASLLFIARELWLLDWASLRAMLSWQLVLAALAAAGLFLMGNQLLARAWVRLTDPGGDLGAAPLVAIYARSVWLKYVPGSVFHFLGRHAEAAKLGISHGVLARSHGLEIALHLVASLSVAALCLTIVATPVVAAIAAGLALLACLAIGKPLTTALLFQLVTFAAIALAAGIVGHFVLSDGMDPAQFAALFLLAWLAGFLVPLAPGGLGVREAALLALTVNSLPSEAVLVALLVLRLASISADLAYGLGATVAKTKPGT